MSQQKVKGYKITDCSRLKRFGVACSSLKELIEKGSKKLCVKEKVTVHLQDGTVVDNESYFKTLPAQTFFILRRDNEYIPTGADLIYNALKSVNIELLRSGDLVKQFFDEKTKEKLQLLCSKVIQKRLEEEKLKKVFKDDEKDSKKAKNSTKEEDPDWFFGLDTNAKTKEAFMFKRSQDRIRSYYYKTRTEIKKIPDIGTNNKVINILENVFNKFKNDLMKDQFFGCYLDRSQSGALCDKDGEFTCGGVWKEDYCLYRGATPHVINPYASREERILFSTWNLDHCVERSRSIIPALVEAAMRASTFDDSVTVNAPYFYSLLFTSRNLRIVHIVCHDKSKHDTAICDNKKYLVSTNRIRE